LLGCIAEPTLGIRMALVSKQHKTVAVLGAGSWGTALAIHLARAGLNVRLWGYHPEHIEVLQKERCNQRYLPDVAFPDNLELYSSLEDRCAATNCWFLLLYPVTPTARF
jgi:glycerol-3-phosphate dehydrogenase (NAD(P)+)